MNNYVGELVENDQRGKGRIISQQDGFIEVIFEKDKKPRPYRLPVCFRKILRFCDPERQKEIQDIINAADTTGEDPDALAHAMLAMMNSTIVLDTKKQTPREESSLEIPRYATWQHFIADQTFLISNEIVALRTKGSKLIKFHDGQLIESRGQTYYYSFESDNELYLPDDTSIEIVRSGENRKATAVHCEEFHIIIACSIYMGQNVPILNIKAEPWQLLQALSDRLQELSPSASPMAKELVCDGFKHIRRNQPLNLGQDKACEMSLNQPVTFIWGPPGTGKTETLARIAHKHMDRGYRVLMLSYSNVSVDGATWRVDKLDTRKIPGRILRYGYPRDKELLEHETLTSYRYVVGKHPEMEAKRKELNEQKRGLSHYSARYIDIEKELKNLKDRLSREEKETIRRTPFVATTISKTTIDKTLFENKYDTVIFDEASMAFFPQIVFAASLATKHFICMGDFCQLPPIVQQDSTCALNVDVFDCCGIKEAVRNNEGHDWLCMLDTQYRMHPDIANFASKCMYRNLLKTADGIKAKRSEITKCKPFAGNALQLVDLTGMLSVCLEEGKSHFNPLSAMVSLGLAVKAAEHHEVGIITPYHAQARLLHAMARDIMAANPDLKNIACATVHQFQGSERPVIIFDAVDCYRQKYPGYMLTDRKNDKADRLFNVALTRAQGKIIVVANTDFMETKNLPENLMFSIYMQREPIFTVTSQQILPEIKNSKLQCGSEEDLTEQYYEDLRNAKSEILIDVPSSKPGYDNSFYKRFCNEFKYAADNCPGVILRTEDLNALPPVLYRVATQSKRAIIPLTIIDRNIVWYGYPVTRANFETEWGSLPIDTRPVFRLEGRALARILIGMLESDRGDYVKASDIYLPDYTPPVIKPKPKPAQPKPTPATQTSIPAPAPSTIYAGRKGNFRHFSDFVLKKLRCERCRKPLILTHTDEKGYKLTCTARGCPFERPVTAKMINLYLLEYSTPEKSLCPIDHTPITAEKKDGKVCIYCKGATKKEPGTDQSRFVRHNFTPATI